MLDTEKYCWLVDAPKSSQSGEFFLNNNNLTSLDPDDYFRVKPKDAQ